MQKKVVNVITQLPVLEEMLLKKTCDLLQISRSRLLRISLGHFTSYLDQLSSEELKQELLKIKRFD